MVICEKLKIDNKISTVEEWFKKCPPQGKERHWTPGRSALETANLWIDNIPKEFKSILIEDKLNYVLCSPEHTTKFDNHGGNGRNHDLVILAENEKSERVLIAIESKVDESFGTTVSKRMVAAKKAKDKSQKSKALDRINDLRKTIFEDENPGLDNLRYQLLTAIVGTIAEAKKQKATTAYFLVQTIITDKIIDKKYLQNQKDLDDFITIFSKLKYKNLDSNILIGPFRLPYSNNYISDTIDLWIGKYEIRI